MPISFFQHQSYAPIITRLRYLVLGFTIVHLLWYEALIQNPTIISPDSLLLNASLSWSLLWQPFTSALIIPYRSMHIGILFDLLLLNFLLSPIFSFIVTFLSRKYFLSFVLQLIAIGTFSFLLIGHWTYALPISLFGSLVAALIIFWAMLHGRSQHSFFVMIPIRPRWIVIITLAFVLLPALLAGAWAKIGTSTTMVLYSYIWAVCVCKLNSNIQALSSFEESLCKNYHRIVQWISWYCLKPLQPLLRKLRRR